MLHQRPLLVVEDSDDDFAILESCLRSAGVSNRLIRCSTGDEVQRFLDEIQYAGVGQRPVFVILDLKLPGTHGHEVLRRLKAHPTLKTTPVVVLTTSAHPSDIEESYRLGAGGFLTKPVELDKFEQMVQHVADYWFSCVKLPENVRVGGS